MNVSEPSTRYSPQGDGYIKVYRKLLSSAVFENPTLLKVWIWCLLRANWYEATALFEGKEIVLERGQFIVGRFTGAEQCNMRPSTFYKNLRKLQELGNVTLKSDNKKTLVTVVNYSGYQEQMASEWQQENNSVTTREQQSSTDKEVKNIRIKEKEGGNREKKGLQGGDTYLSLFLSNHSNPSNLSVPGFAKAFGEWVEYRKEKKKPVTETMAEKQLLWLSKQPDPVACIEQSIRNGWQGLFELKSNETVKRNHPKRRDFTPEDLRRYDY